MLQQNHCTVNTWVFDVSRCLENHNGTELALLLSLKCNKLSQDNLYGLNEENFQTLTNQSFNKFDKLISPGICQFFSDYLMLRVSIANNLMDWDDILKKSFKLLDLWLDIYLDENLTDHHWLVPVLYSLCNFTSIIGSYADKANVPVVVDGQESDDEDDKDKYMKQVLNNVRSKMGRVRGDESRHSAYIVLLGQSIKGCMQLGNMQMAAGFLKAIESTTINYSRALRGPLINFRYYLGKLHMQKEEYIESEEHLSWAFSNCLKDNVKMRRHILECLIVVRLGLGKMPPEYLLEKYNLTHYSEIVKSIVLGDVERFNNTLDNYFEDFIKEGTILCVEQLKFLAYRTLIRKSKEWWNTYVPSGKNNMLPVGVLTATAGCQVPEMTDLEMLCICGNLIKRGYMKGYISWERLTIVFSTVQPFPQISTV
ncbi:PCI domain protein [Theileria parva strain Muguga]|uniref:Uncharacterized protein n=1 Tax=Theileria parva TaxID=5875 RepID=Q4N5D2_THEPA|nr:PCI domain protein [Theileria parva strain Muguga]EAN32641.1 PCI domain protein [Theileria parva strain Muguga]|eukprot:XP_764924.1 hypothetical protein [Theileria parva strain Muguga]